MSAGILNFDGDDAHVCEQGADFAFNFHWEDENNTTIALSEYTIRMQVRKNFEKTLIVEFSTTNGRITIDSNEEVTVSLPAAQTALLEPGKYIYDMEVVDAGGAVTRILQGQFNVSPEVTI